MTKQEIINRCYSEIQKLNDNSVLNTSEMDFYNNFTNKYSPFSYEMFSKISGTDFLIAVVNSKFEDIPFEKVYKDLNTLRGLLDDDDPMDIKMLFGALCYISDNNLDDRIIDSLNDSNRYRIIKNIKGLFSAGKDIDSIFNDVLKKEQKDSSAILPLLEYNRKDHDFICDVLRYIIESKEMKYCIKKITGELSEIARQAGVVLSGRELSKSIDKSVKETIKANFHTNEIKNSFTMINNYHKKLDNEAKNTAKNKMKTIKAYEGLINGLTKSFTSSEITNYESLVKNIPSEEIRIATLKLIYQHNKINYEELESIYNELSKNSTVHFLALLKQYNISNDEVNLSKIMRNDYDTVDDILKLVSYITTDKSVIINALHVSDVLTCKYLKELKNKGVISNATISKYPNIFNPMSNEFKTLCKNIKNLAPYKINPAIFVNNPNVMLESDIKRSLDILEEYDLMKYMKNSSDYNYLAKDNLCGLIDKVLELGFEDYLVNDLSLLNENNWDRIYVLKSLGYEVENKEELVAYLRKNTFFIPDDKLKDYIPNIVSDYKCVEDKLLSGVLNKYNAGERIFNIDGIIVSKNRFNKNYKNNSKSLMKCILDGGIYSRDEVEHIEKVLYETKEK